MRKILRLVRNIIFICFIVVLVGAFLFHKQIIDVAKEMVSEKVAATVMDSGTLDSKTSAKVSEVYNQMDAADKEKVVDVIKKNMSLDNLKEAQSYILSGNTDGLESFAKNTLSETDEQTLKDLYGKYKSQITNP